MIELIDKPRADNRPFSKSFKYVSLFSGIGGFEQALNSFGGTCVFASEIDKFAAQSYKALYGGEVLHGDITKINAEDIPDHDILVGGFPCQAFSVAGQRKGFDDTRGTLFFDVARIASVKQPNVLLLENVKGLVGHDKGKTLDTIVEVLNDIGYVVDFDVLNSKYFGVPQNRERIFIVAIREDLIDVEGWNFTEGQTIVPKGKRRISKYERTKSFNFNFPNSETEYDYYTKSARDRIRAAERILSDEQASEQRKVNARKRIEESTKVIDEYKHLKPKVTSVLRDILEVNVDERYYLDEDKTARLIAELSEGDNIESNDDELQYLGDVDIKGHRSIKAVYGSGGVSPTLTTMQGGHQEPKIAEEVVGGLPIKEATVKGYAVACEGDAVNFQFPDSKTRRGRVGKGIANTLEASSINQGVVIAKNPHERMSRQAVETFNSNECGYGDTINAYNRTIDKSSISPTLTTRPEGFKTAILPITKEHRIRKLTPLECFRLQGFSDEVHQIVVDAGLSDSQRYKQAGNAVTVNVIKALAERLLPYI